MWLLSDLANFSAFISDNLKYFLNDRIVILEIQNLFNIFKAYFPRSLIEKIIGYGLKLIIINSQRDIFLSFLLKLVVNPTRARNIHCRE
jgi:hypothetical protein